MSNTHFVPVFRHTVVDRPRLFSTALGNEAALTILRGGGGTGKSLAAAQYAREFASPKIMPSASPHAPERHSVWVRCSVGLRSIEVFWQEVFDALMKAGIARAGTQAEVIAQGGATNASIDILSNAICSLKAEILVIFDDFHHIAHRDLEAQLLEVLENCPNLRLMLTSRVSLSHLTSAQTRMRLPVLKINAASMAFTKGEITQLVTHRFTHFSPEAADRIASRVLRETSGWPLAVQALILETESQVSETSSLSGGSLEQNAFIRSLADRMLEGASREQIEALCIMAYFSEATTSSLAYILDLPNDWIEGFFCSSFEPGFDYWDDETGNRWYRLHDLLVSELRGRAEGLLGTARMQQLASRAARAFHDSRPRLALQAALFAQEWELLSELLTEGSVLTLSRTRDGLTLQDIPTPVLEKFPILAAFTLMHEYAFPTGRIRQAVSGFRVLASRMLVKISNEESTRGIVATILRMIVARLGGVERTAVSMAHQALDRLSSMTTEELYALQKPLQIGINQIAITFIHSGHYVSAIEVLELLRQWEGRLRPESYAHTLSLLAWAHAWRGDLPEARHLLKKCEKLEIPMGWKDSYIGAGYRIAAAIDLLENGYATAAHQHLYALAEHESTIEHWPFLSYLETLILETLHGNAAAIEYIERQIAKRKQRSAPLPSALGMLTYLHARIQWHAGKVLPLPKKRSKTDWTSNAVIAAISRGNHELVATFATEAGSFPQMNSFHRARAEMLLLQAMSALLDGDEAYAEIFTQQAVSILCAYSLTMPVRILPRSVAQSLQELVPELPIEQSLNVSIRNIEPLTAGERRALVAVAQHGNVSAAASALHLSPSTVKAYMKHVYRKLKVNRRRDALRVAADAGILVDPEENVDAEQ